MKVLMVSREFLPSIGGIQRVVGDLCRSLERKGIKTRVLTQTKGSHPSAVIVSTRNPIGLILRVIKEKPDLVHVHGFRAIGLFAWIGAKLLGRPVVVTPHWDYSLDSLKQKLNVLFHRLLGFNKVIALTKTEEKLLAGKGFKNIELISNAVDLKEFSLVSWKENSFARKHSIKKSDAVVLFAGRLAANKGLPVLIEAFSKLKQKNRKLFIVGPEDKRFDDTTFEFFRKNAGRFGVESKFELTGPLDGGELVEAFSACNVFVLPSTASEAFGLVLIQAMALGKPVIASSIGGIPEVVDDKKNGLLVKAGSAEQLSEAISLLLEDKALARKLGENGRKKATENYSLEKIVSRHIELYKNLTS